MKKDKEVMVVDDKDVQVVQQSPMEMGQAFLVASGGDVVALKEMMEFQKEYDSYQAKKAYIRAMAEFKKEPIKILKDMENKQYGSKYASIGAMVLPCLPRMGDCGLSHKWEFENQTDQKFLTGMCVVTHIDGHSDSVSMSCPIDTSGAKNPIQQIKSTRTYIKIETFTSIMGLTSSEDVDDDGNSAGAKLIDEKQVSILTDLINEFVKDTSDFLKWAKVASIDQLPLNQYGKVKSALEGLKNDN